MTPVVPEKSIRAVARWWSAILLITNHTVASFDTRSRADTEIPMANKSDETIGPAEGQVFELTMDNDEDQDESDE